MSATVRAIVVACILVAGGCSSPGVRSLQQTGPAEPAGVSAGAIERGRLLTSTACAGCHATGSTGDSPLPDATPLREIVRRYPMNRLEEAFAEGLVTTHPAMPGYIFRASEIDDIVAWLETLEAEQ
ncbi:cytochrome c [Brevundimonas sp.]|uniref:c-type cytochrome n=1 Tax=Brevundimonas sp. TaxID=1871086 RepID=UPI002737C94A|nr:cytochrome c [Brevundimonas sp.]MDP3802332.1 cytochrome c [Brevundimonas sp.]